MTDKRKASLFLTSCRHQERRREEFLRRSRQARSDALAKARGIIDVDDGNLPFERPQARNPSASIATSLDREAHADVHETSSAEHAKSSFKAYYASQLMPLEYMIEVPPSLGTSWRVLPRPEGKRCLLIASRGQTVTRLRTGAILHVFASALPNGSRKTRRSNKVFCMLDCVYHEPQRTYYVMDIMAWNGIYLHGASMECRSMWSQSHLQFSAAVQEPFPGHDYRLASVRVLACDGEGLREAYSGPCPYQRDGLLFIHKDSPYVLEPNAYALLWKDAVCSRWPVDTDKHGRVPPKQELILEYSADGTVVTGDRPEGIVLGRMPAHFLEAAGSKTKPGTLLKFTLGEGGVQLGPDGLPVGADLELGGVAHARRGAAAHTFSRIVFQWQMRSQGSAFEALLAVVQANALRGRDAEPRLDMCDDDMDDFDDALGGQGSPEEMAV